MKGSVKITKVYSDGREELVCEDNNILADGLGVGIINIFTDIGSTELSDHIVGYFQAGTGRLNPGDQDVAKARYISTLDAPLTSQADYGTNAEVMIDTHELVAYHQNNFSPTFQESILESSFAFLPDTHSTKMLDGVVNYRLVLSESMANDVGSPITEFGLFSRDINNNIRNDQSVLIAYKNFPEGEGVNKTRDFSLVVDWQIKFIDGESESEVPPPPPPRNNVVVIMIDDVGPDQLGMYDSINAYDITNATHPNATPFSPIDDPTNGSGIYPSTPVLSALGAGGMTFFNCRAQPMCSPTRATLLSGRYNFSTKNFGGTGNAYWGPGIGMVFGNNAKRLRSGLKGLNDGYRFLDANGELKSLAKQVPDNEGNPNTITATPLFGDYMSRNDVSYQSAFFGKWHLAAWIEAEIYCEEGAHTHPIVGAGWGHIKDKGKWDHYVATFSNLNTAPIPGFKYLTQSWDLPLNWPHYDGDAAIATDGKQMGYVNFFANENDEVLLTVSDAGYVTYGQSASGMIYKQGDASSFATNFILSAASSYFNTAEEPFFMYVSPNMPHTPYTYPPSGGVYTPYYNENNRHILLQDGMDEGDSVSSTWVATNAMLENFDYQLGQFFGGLRESRKNNTIWIITSDNGSVHTDMSRRADWASSIGLGAGSSIQPVISNAAGSGGFGDTYDKMLNLGAYCSSLTPSAVRRGGENDTANQFKASLYDRGMIVPMIVSGPGVLPGVSTNALVDLTDILATTVEIAGGFLGGEGGLSVPTDSISFYDVLTGKVDASSHPRQHSFGEIYFAIGNSTGPTSQWGSYTGFVGCGDDQVELSQPDNITNLPYVPRRRRIALTMRLRPEQFFGLTPAQTATTITHLEQDGTIDPPGSVTVNAKQNIPDASAGIWKVLRPGAGGVGLGSGFPGDTDEINLGLGRWYEELYHLQSINFENVDSFELVDVIPEDIKGVEGNYIISSLIVSAVNEIGGSGPLDNTVHYWNLARIFEAAHECLGDWNNLRRTPAQTMISEGGGELSPGDEGGG